MTSAEADALTALAACPTPEPGTALDAATLARIEARAVYTRKYRGLVARSVSGAWTLDGLTLRAGGLRIVSFPHQSAGEVRRSPLLARFFLFLGREPQEEVILSLVAELKRVKAEKQEAVSLAAQLVVAG